MTTDVMLGRLFALIHDSPPQTPAEFEADRADAAYERARERARMPETWD